MILQVRYELKLTDDEVDWILKELDKDEFKMTSKPWERIRTLAALEGLKEIANVIGVSSEDELDYVRFD